MAILPSGYTKRSIRPGIFCAAVLSLLGFLIYSDTLCSPFHFDDISFIVTNPALRFVSFKSILGYWMSRSTGILSFALNYKLHGLSVFGYHLVNLFIHISCSFLIFLLASLTFSTPAIKTQAISKYRKQISFFASAVFLAHPVQTETLNYIFQRTCLLAAFFYLASLCLYIKAMLLPRKGAGSRFCYCFSWLSALLAMFSKENAFSLPFIILLYDFCFLKQEKANWKYIGPFFILLPVIPLTVLIAKPLVLIDAQRMFNNPLVNSGQYILTQFRVVLTYIRLVFLPVGQNLDYDYRISTSLWEMPVLSSIFALAIIIFLASRLFARYRVVYFGIFWFFITLLPESSIIPALDVIYEHRLYLPLAGLTIAIVSSLYYFFSGAKKAQLVSGALVLLIAVFAILSYNRNLVWEDEFSLWDDTVKKSPRKIRPYNERGLAYFDRGDYDRAILDFTTAIRLNPAYVDGYYNRGLAQGRKREYGKAISDYSRAIQLNPQYLKAYYNRGVIYYINKEYEPAISDFNKALSISPDFSCARYYLDKVYQSKAGEASKF